MPLSDSSKPDNENSEVLLSRSGVLATAAGVAILCGALLPLPRVLVDIVWGCSLCLSAALLLIASSAKPAIELAGFAPLMAVAALLRMALYAASAKLILYDNMQGTLIEMAGRPLALVSSVLAVTAPPVLAVIVLIAVFRYSRRIIDVSFECITETLPLKRIEIETDEKAGIMDGKEADRLKQQYFREAGFYLNSAGVAKLLRCDAALSLIVIIGIVAGRLVVCAAEGALGETALRASASAASGTAVLILVPLIVVSVVSARLVVRCADLLKASDSAGEWAQGYTVEIVSQETGAAEKVELLNPDFAEVAENRQAEAVGSESIVEFEPVETSGGENAAYASGVSMLDDYYESIAKCILTLGPEHAPVLFASVRKDSLPVTVAVNVSIRLCENERRILLIDGERSRNALAEVFDVAPARSRRSPVETCIEGLWIWKCDMAARSLEPELIGGAGEFDLVMIYAPDMDESGVIQACAASARAALAFSEDDTGQGDLCAKLEGAGCKVVASFTAP